MRSKLITVLSADSWESALFLGRRFVLNFSCTSGDEGTFKLTIYRTVEGPLQTLSDVIAGC